MIWRLVSKEKTMWFFLVSYVENFPNKRNSSNLYSQPQVKQMSDKDVALISEASSI